MDIIFKIIHFNPSFHVKLSYCEKKTRIFFVYKHNKTNGFLLHNYPVTVHTNLYSLYNLIVLLYISFINIVDCITSDTPIYQSI